jgi:trimeric autotransporter adhesin
LSTRLSIPGIALLALAALLSALPRGSSGAAENGGTIVAVAGTGAAGFAGEKSLATQGQLFLPHGFAFDAKRLLNFADALNHRVRRLGPKGKIVTVVGKGGSGATAGGFAGDGGTAAGALFDEPLEIAFQAGGNLFVADSLNNRVRKVDSRGNVSTVAGSGPVGAGKGGFAGDNGQALLNQPAGITLDGTNNLYIADSANHRVRKVGPNGVITTFAGTGDPGATGDGGVATAAHLTTPYGLALDAGGDLYVSDLAENVVRKILASGIITTVAGTGTAGFSGDGGVATKAQLNQPRGLAVDSAGNLFIADSGNHRVRQVDKNGTMTTVAGNGTLVFAGDGGLSTNTGLRGPVDVAVGPDGSLFISDSGSFADRVDKMGPGERVLKVTGVAAPGLRNGQPF